MTGIFAADGCVAPNIRTRDYRLTFTATCEHGKVRGAEIVISAPSEVDALQFAATWLQQGVMRNTTLTGIEEIQLNASEGETRVKRAKCHSRTKQ